MSESLREEALRRGVSVSRVRAIRKAAAGLCSQCPVSKGRTIFRAGLCGEHYAGHLNRSRERMRRLWAEGRHPDQIRKKRKKRRRKE